MAGRKSDFTLPTLDDLFSTQELRDDAKLSKIRDIPLELIDDFPDHPFKVRDDEDMIQLVESVKERGVITPATVRQKEDGRYELVSGHRRKRACEIAGFDTLRCEVVDLDRDAATILMVESNFQRSQILGGGITAFAASSSGEVAKSYSIGFPRSGDANLDYSGTWGHDELHYMNGWTSGEATWMTTLHTIGSFDGPACYCIEPGVPRLLEKTYTRFGEDYWKNYPSDYNSTIDADTIKTLLGRIMQYGYQGDLSLDWRSQNEADADKMAHMMATQVLVWETVVGERDANFNHVDPGNADAVKSMYRTSHPLYSRFSAYYDSIEASVQSHTVIPSFMSKTPNKAQTVELKWDGNQYTATLTDSNHVVSNYTFSSNLSDIVFTTNGDTLTITAKTAPAEPVTISASKNNIRKGVVVWSDGHYGPDGTMQDALYGNRSL